jgi:inorganic pyrophosphatase/K(+)-stimulated pyrophosphate-energized sodium pump
VIIASFGLAYWLMPRVPGTLLFGVPGIAFSIISGLVAGWLIGKWTEYCTSTEFKPTKRLADQAVTGPATIIIGGIADGMASVWFPIVVICVASMTAFGFATGGRFNDIEYFTLGLYGIGIAAVGMLSTLGITLATDAYGPIADNAGGNAEMSELPEFVRTRTDALDALGNTTAATGKGFAIGSAALTALALLAAYVEGVRDGFMRWGDSVAVQVSEDGLYKVSSNLVVQRQGSTNVPYLVLPTQIEKAKVRANWEAVKVTASPVSLSPDLVNVSESGPAFASTGDALVSVKSATLRDFMMYYDATLLNPRVLIGMFLGAMATFLFCAMTMQAVGRAAQGMVIEVRRQLKERPGILDGSEKPDYARPIELSTKAAQREMLWPSVIGLVLPIGVGLLFGVGGVLGLLGGSLTTGFCLAVFMANSGGAWDNAKKYIESGVHGGKGSPAHKAAVVGDTVGDPFKDTSGPSLNILIKLMSMVSVVVAGLVVRYSLVAAGWF